jgi:aminoglycoside 3'-phosphotransferase II
MIPEGWQSSLPASWQRNLRRFRLERIRRGMGDAAVFRASHPVSGELYLKVTDVAGLSNLRSEVRRTKWLGTHGVRVPRILRIFDDDRLGVVLMTAIPGRHPEEVERSSSEVIDRLARSLCELHAIPINDCPFDETVPTRLDRAQQAIKRGAIEPEHFAKRNRKLTPEALYTRLSAAAPPHEDIVLVHGDARFDNILIDDEGRVGFIDCGHSGRGDRYLDLEAVIADINEHFGTKCVRAFAHLYGETEFDLTKLRFFSDLYELF